MNECGELFRLHKSVWEHLVPSSPDRAPILVEHYFNTACSLMGRHLREAVENSLDEFINFLSLYQEGNDYEGEFGDLMFVFNPVIF